jgi:hypothetical protein
MASTLAPSAVANAIRRGDHDAELAQIEYAIASRKKNLFRPGVKVRLVNLRPASPDMEGKVGTVVKVNAKRITVGLGERTDWGGWTEGEPLVPIEMLEIVR